MFHLEWATLFKINWLSKTHFILNKSNHLINSKQFSSYDDSEVDEFYRELQSLVDQAPKRDILVVQGDWNAKVGEDAQEDWGEVCEPFLQSKDQ